MSRRLWVLILQFVATTCSLDATIERHVLRMLSNKEPLDQIVSLIEKHGIDLNKLVLEEKKFFHYVISLCMRRSTYQQASWLIRAIDVGSDKFVGFYLLGPFIIDTYYGGTLPTVHAARRENYKIAEQLVIAGAQLPYDWQNILNKISDSITCSKRMQNFKKIYDLYLALSRLEASSDEMTLYEQLACMENTVLFNRILFHLLVGGNRLKNSLFNDAIVHFNVDAFRTFIKKYDQNMYEKMTINNKICKQKTLTYRLAYQTEKDVLYGLLISGVITITHDLINRVADRDKNNRLLGLMIGAKAVNFNRGYDVIIKTHSAFF